MYKKNKHIHFMGIGGIGVSGIAAILKQQGYTVSGCDETEHSQILGDLKKLGCVIYCGHSFKHIDDVDVLVYSSAIDIEHKEVKSAIKKEFQLFLEQLTQASFLDQHLLINLQFFVEVVEN